MSDHNAWPRIQLLELPQINQVHDYSIEILQKTGIRVDSQKARELFKHSGGASVKDDMVYISRELADHAIKSAPETVNVYAQTGEPAFSLGKEQGRETYFGIGVTNSWFQEIETDKVVPFRREHMQYSSSLGDILDNYDMVSTIGIPSDCSPEKSDLYSTLDMYACTKKPIVLLVQGENKIEEVFSLLNYMHGDISTKPFCIPYVNLITPLVLNESTTEKMIASIEMNLPVIFSNYSMYGGTSPATGAGTLALLNAELLAGLVFSQLVKEGSKIILGSLPAAFNMTNMGSYYTPQSYLLNLACAEMMAYYGIPHCGTSGSNNGRGADLPAAGHLWLNHLTSCIGKVGCVPFVGGNFDSMAFSPALAVLSDLVIAETRTFARGFDLNDETVNLEEINKLGPAGNFFTSEQTLSLLTGKPVRSELWPSLNLKQWEDQKMPRADDELIAYTCELYKKARLKTEDSRDIIAKGDEFIANMRPLP